MGAPIVNTENDTEATLFAWLSKSVYTSSPADATERAFAKAALAYLYSRHWTGECMERVTQSAELFHRLKESDAIKAFDIALTDLYRNPSDVPEMRLAFLNVDTTEPALS